MRNLSIHKQRHIVHIALKSLLFVLLFSLVFAGVIISNKSSAPMPADAAAGVEAVYKSATANTISSLVNGYNEAKSFNNNNTDAYRDRFGVSSELSDGVTAFCWNTAKSAWGYVDWASSDNANVWWLEFTFTSSALKAVKDGDISYYAAASIDFSDGTNDESALAVSFVSVHARPSVSFIGTGRSGNSASWSATGTSQTHARSAWSDSYTRTDTVGQTSFSREYTVPKEATGIRLIFAGIADGKMHGGFSNLALQFYKNAKVYTSTATSETVSETVSFNSEAQVTNYLHVFTKNDSAVSSDQGFKFRASVSRTGNSKTFSKTNSYGAYALKNGGDIEFIGAVAIKIGSNSKKYYTVSGGANVALWAEGGGSATVTAKAAAQISADGKQPTSGFSYPSAQTSLTVTKLQTTESSSRGAHINVKGGYSQAFSSAWSDGSARVSTTSIVVRGGETFWIYVRMASTDDRVSATTSRAILLDSVSFTAVPFFEGSGSSTSPFLLKSRNDFDSLSNLVSTKKEPFESTYFKVSPTSGTYINMSKYANGTSADVFATVGTSTTPFGGILDGDGKTLYGLTLSSTRSVSGLFSYVKGATIKNLTIGTSTTYGTADIKGVVVGGIVGQVAAGTAATAIDSCAVNAPVTGTGSGTGGIVGSMADGSKLTVTNSCSTKAINSTGSYGAGGIVGYFNNDSSLTVTNCYCSGAIICSGNGTGGILGYVKRGENSISIKNSYSTGAIKGRINVGGIAGRVETTRTNANSVEILNCYATGAISYDTTSTSDGTVGGIVGYLFYSGASTANNTMIVRYCYRSGSTSHGGTNVGGIVGVPRSYVNNSSSTPGNANNVKIQNCYNVGTVSSSSTSASKGVGGVVGGAEAAGNVYTVTDSWALISSANRTDNGDNVGTNPSKTGRRIEYATTSAITTYPIIGYERGSWTNATTGVIANNVTGFAIYVSGTVNFPTGRSLYLSLTKETEDGEYYPPNRTMNNNEVLSSTEYSSYFAVYAGYYASNTSNLYVCTKEILPANLTSVYGEGEYDEYGVAKSFADPQISSVARNNYKLPNQIYSFSLTYQDGVAPVDVGDYAATVEIYLEGKVVGRRTVTHTVTPRPLTFTPSWSSGQTSSNPYTYIYNKYAQGLLRVAASNIVAGETVDNIIEVETTDGIDWQFDTAVNVVIVASTVNAKVYTLSISIKNLNYDFSETTDSNWTWTIDPKDINGLIFGYGSFDGSSNQQAIVLGGSTVMGGYFALDVAESPYALIYKDSNNIYSINTNYRWYFGDTLLAIGTEYSLSGKESGAALAIGNSEADVIPFSDSHVSSVEFTFSGVGNYTGQRTVKFTLLDSDFGGNFSSPNWGSIDNPYVIAHDAHLLRLSQISNGGRAWNSIRGDSSIAMVQNPCAEAINRSYDGTYFVLAANVAANTNGGFKPIACADPTLYRFGASFDGGGYTVTLKISENGANFSYLGLFGYVAGNTGVCALSDITVAGSVEGNVGTVNSTYGVGGLAGFVGQNVTFENLVNDGCSVSGNRNVGGLFGMAFGSDIVGRFEKSGKTASVAGGDYVGGIVGFANGVEIGASVTAAANVSGASYVGGVVGYWVTPSRQTELAQDNSAVSSNVLISGEIYVGGFAGWVDVRGGLRMSPYVSNGTEMVITVEGTSYIGGLFGGFDGSGYKRSSASLAAGDSVINIRDLNSEKKPYIRVDVTPKNGGRVIGGLLGYASGVGIVFAGSWTALERTPIGNAANGSVALGGASFVGGIVGVLGENGMIESASQLSEGGYDIGGQPIAIRYSNSSSDMNKFRGGGDFIGTIVGYIASTAGRYLSADTTVIGNSVQLFNGYTSKVNTLGGVDIEGGSYVGGIFGAMGRVNYNGLADDRLLNNLLQYGVYSATVTSAAGNTLRYAPSDDGGIGKLINRGAVKASGSYAGGIVGYVGSGALLALVNSEVGSGLLLEAASSYLSVFSSRSDNLSNETKSEVSSGIIQAESYAGGIAGYLSSNSHTLTGIINTMRVSANTSSGSYAGGIVGYMDGGTLTGCVSGYSAEAVSVSGAEYVGGLVGMLAGGETVSSFGYNFDFGTVNGTRGGVVGSAQVGTRIISSWTVYTPTAPTYSTVSANRNGKYVIIDSKLTAVGTVGKLPNVFEYAVMAGIFSQDAQISLNATDRDINRATAGKLSLRTLVPPANNNSDLKDKQLVFYDVSGNDKPTLNTFDVMVSVLNGVPLGDMYYRFNMSSASSFSVCVDEVRFNTVPIFKNSETDPEGGNENAANAYRKPASGCTKYSVAKEETDARYESDGNIKTIKAIVRYLVNGKQQIVGEADKSFDIGSNLTPYVISLGIREDSSTENPQAWIDFVTALNNINFDGYANKHVKLAADITITSAYLAGNPSLTTDIKNFRGTFDGDGHSITLRINSSTQSGLSVFPNASGATFKNLTIKGNITTTAENAAAFVAKPMGDLKFYNCTNEMDINAKRSTGGLVGYTNGKTISLVACVNKGKIETSDPVEVVDDTEEKDVEPRPDKGLPDFANYKYGTGGIIGYATNKITIESCKNEGKITAGYNVGGIIGQNDAQTNIYNCANTGEILGDAYWESEEVYAKNDGGGTYRMVYAGGIIGKVGQHGYLKMYACYNSGTVTGFGPLVGGLAGSVGYLLMDGADTGIAGGESIIAYCYNTGAVNSAGTRRNGTANEHRSQWWETGREELNGSIVGGIVGFIAWGKINYCYNLGAITTYRIIGYAWVWQARIGGIAGQAQPSGSDYRVSFNYCYNLGLLFVHQYEYVGVGGILYADPYWGGGICGYLDKNGDQSKMSSTACYTIKNYLHLIDVGKKVDKWGSASINNVNSDDLSRYVIGTIVDSVADLTAYLGQDGSLNVTRPINGLNNQAATLINSYGSSIATYNGESVTYNSNYEEGTLQGYIYIQGCLPQLAVFALDTKAGLSMLSVSYGQNEYKEWKGSIAGSKESPYIIKDGVDLLAMSTLLRTNGGNANYPYNFKGKYVAFADGKNNIEGLKAAYIYMDMNAASYAMKSSASESYTQTGKNYFLWNKGAASGYTNLSYGASPTSASTIRTGWMNKNYYFDGLSKTTGSAFADYANFYPIGTGGYSSFEGSISGLQGSSSNTQIRNLKISQKAQENCDTFAGLFGSVYNASISNITVTGTVSGYAYDNVSKYNVFAGGIAGYAGGSATITNCKVGVDSSTYNMTVNAYSSTSAVNYSYGGTYAGGIIGAAGPLKGKEFSQSDVSSLLISGANVYYTTVTTAKNNAGGVAGYAGNPWGTECLSDNTITFEKSAVSSSTVCAKDGANASYAGTDIGGIVGTNDGKALFRITGFGTYKTTVSGTTVTGKHSVGGIIGTARGNAEISDVDVKSNTKIERKLHGSTYNAGTSGGVAYLTSMGGIIGRSLADTKNFLQGSIAFRGSIEADVTAETGNIGGIIGTMGTGTRFLSGSTVIVSGSISVTAASSKNIGGVAGLALNGAFDGTFTISTTMQFDSAVRVGGFIGLNIGDTNILSSDTGTRVTVNAKVKGLSEVGGLVGQNGDILSGVMTGSLKIGADTYLGSRYEGSVTISIGATVTGSENVGGIVGRNYADSRGSGQIVITKGVITITGSGSVSGVENADKGLNGDNIGGIVGNNVGEISMGGSSVAGAALTVTNNGTVTGHDNVGGVIGYLQQGSIAGTFKNTGSVVGANYVGGSIGRMDAAATLTAVGVNTYFLNGEVGSAAVSSNSALVAADTSGGTVTGSGNYVGGSIGAVFGNIEGRDGCEVCFENAGTVSGASFVGGNIGMLAGAVSAAQFTNSGSVTSSGNKAIGGSVGLIGIDPDLAEITHVNVSVKNVHFEFIGTQGITASGSDNEAEGGVGGAIGIIGGKNEGFDNTDKTKWQNVTMYAASDVTAAGLTNVGGAIGLIKADNIVIANMLAFYTSIVGWENVGGIIGGIESSGIEVTNSFNIEGTVTAMKPSDNHAGGIIGLAADNTDADTSYWVKGYANEVLMTLNIDNISESLGEYEAVIIDGVVFTSDLTEKQYPTPSDYTGNESDGESWKIYLQTKLNAMTGKTFDVQIQNGVWAYKVDNWTMYTTGRSTTGWYYVYANNHAGIDVTHIDAAAFDGDQFTYQSVLNTVAARNAELAYWKRIANAYTDSEIESGEDKKNLDSQIIAIIDMTNKAVINDGKGDPKNEHIYAAAAASTDSGYYLYMDASGIKPNVYHSTQESDGNFYIDASTSTADNVVVYYRSLSIGRPLIYNGYNRYAAITDAVSENETIKYAVSEKEINIDDGNYFYTMSNMFDENGDKLDAIYKAGTYTVDVIIHYYDSFCNLAVIGGIQRGEFIINKQPLDVELNASNGEYNASDTGGWITLKVSGIAPLDTPLDRWSDASENRTVKFSLKSREGLVDCDDVDLGRLMKSKTQVFDYENRDAANDLLFLGTQKIYLNVITVENDVDISDTSCIASDDLRYSNGKKAYSISLKFRFTERIVNDNLVASLLDTVGASKNYKAKDENIDFEVMPKAVTIEITSENDSAHYNGGEHSASFKFNGWAADDHNGGKTAAIVADFLPYLIYLPKNGTAEGVQIDGQIWDVQSEYTLKDSGLTYASALWWPLHDAVNVSRIKFEGDYKISFATKNEYNGKPATSDGNYYLADSMPKTFFSIKPNQLAMSWGNDEGVYNALKHDFAATFTADEDFESPEALEGEAQSIFPSGYSDFEYSIQKDTNRTVTVIFKVGPKAGTHSVTLPKMSTDRCVINNITVGRYTITPLAISVNISGSTSEVYNGGFHTAEKLEFSSDNSDIEPTYTFNPSDGRYTVNLFTKLDSPDVVRTLNIITIQITYGGETAAVNAGTYIAALDGGSVGGSGKDNFTVTTDGSGSVTITPAVITLDWKDENTFIYNAKAQGRGLTAQLTTAGDGMTLTSASYTPATSNAAMTINISNAYSSIETVRVPVGGTPAATNSSSYTASVSLAAHSVLDTANTNASDSGSVKENYTIAFESGKQNDGNYTIKPIVMSVSSVSGSTTSKVYDATRDVVKVGTPQFEGLGSVAAPEYSITATYDSANVGSRTITYTIRILNTVNYKFSESGAVTAEKKVNGSITARSLTVNLDILRNRAATRLYNGNTSYGGKGAFNTNGSASAVSDIHRSGEGFSVSGFAVKESTNAVTVTAAYAEAASGRAIFDAYVNNVVGSGANLSVGSAKRGEREYFYKKLVFTLVGASAANYTFTVKVGSTEVGDRTGTSSSSGAVTVYDGMNGGIGGLTVEITPNVLRASYVNTAQSYANADNSYNTNWEPVSGTVSGVSGDSLRLVFVNNWMYEGGSDRNPEKIYKSYTVIRGAVGSKVLSARVDSADGVHVNYSLSNQPVLTIGYFVDKEEFEIGSLASLMIATYYYAVSKSNSNEFGEIVSQAVWNKIASADEYASGEGFPTEVTDGNGDTVEISSWNEYFAFLASEAGGSHYVFLNENEGEKSGWGYYAVDEDSLPISYDRFKQIANISGVFTAQDIAILDGMFRRTTVDGEGNVIEDMSYDWGVGGQYLTNFVKGGVGSVVTAMGAIFTGTFGGSYGGGGYVIDKMNIVGISKSESGYFGMFDRIAAADGAPTAVSVQNVHLRNINITVSGTAMTLYVGGIAGESVQDSVSNVSVHGTFTISTKGAAYVGGLFGASSGSVNGAIVLGSMSVKAAGGYVGGAIGRIENGGSLENVISLMQINAGVGVTVGGIVGVGNVGGVNGFMKNSVWSGGTAISGGRTYSELYGGSVGGYKADSLYYYVGESGNAKGEYDVLADVKLTALDGADESRSNPHESMRLADIIDIYVLLYSKTQAPKVEIDGSFVEVFGMSESSPLVGNKHGTDRSGDAIVIGNVQGVALLRELRFATFTLIRDVDMGAAYMVSTASGAFYGKVIANGYYIYAANADTAKMFEIEVSEEGGTAPTALLKSK